jgi:aquaporin Z
MNPALTLTFLFLKKISRRDAFYYVVFQFLGGAAAMLIFNRLFPDFVGNPAVNYVQTLPGPYGIWPAFAGETLISFGLVLTVLYAGNDPRTAPFTGIFAATLVMLYITFEDPLSGMSMNPARTAASAIAAGQYGFVWIYFLAPPLGMLGAASLWKWWICQNPDFHCGLHAADGWKKNLEM